MRLRRNGQETAHVWRYSLPLAAFFFLGLFAGITCAGRTGNGISDELTAYLSAYLDAVQEREITASVLCSLLLAYLWGPAAAFFLGFTAAGAFLPPALALAYGFFPAYAAGCLAVSFSGQGIWMALCFFGFRCLVTVPCFFLLAAPSWQTAAGRLGASLGRGRFAPADSRGCWFRFAGVCLILSFGVCGDLKLSPLLLRWLLGRIF